LNPCVAHCSTDSIPWVYHSREEGSLDYDGGFVHLQIHMNFDTIIYHHQVPRHVTRLVAPLIVDYSASRRLVADNSTSQARRRELRLTQARRRLHRFTRERPSFAVPGERFFGSLRAWCSELTLVLDCCPTQRNSCGTLRR
jgi:hypothetical protein